MIAVVLFSPPSMIGPGALKSGSFLSLGYELKGSLPRKGLPPLPHHRISCCVASIFRNHLVYFVCTTFALSFKSAGIWYFVSHAVIPALRTHGRE